MRLSALRALRITLLFAYPPSPARCASGIAIGKQARITNALRAAKIAPAWRIRGEKSASSPCAFPLWLHPLVEIAMGDPFLRKYFACITEYLIAVKQTQFLEWRITVIGQYIHGTQYMHGIVIHCSLVIWMYFALIIPSTWIIHENLVIREISLYNRAADRYLKAGETIPMWI